MEKRQLRSFSRADEYLYAMKEDLAEWLNMLYPNINIHAENFMDCLQTGEHLLRVSRAVKYSTEVHSSICPQDHPWFMSHHTTIIAQLVHIPSISYYDNNLPGSKIVQKV